MTVVSRPLPQTLASQMPDREIKVLAVQRINGVVLTTGRTGAM